MLSSGYILNETETKLFCFGFISDVTTALVRRKKLNMLNILVQL